MPDQQRIAEIEDRCEAATPGPWYVPLYGYSIDDNETNLFYAFGMGEQVNADMRFVAASREDIPFLLSLLAAKDAEIELLREAQRCDGCFNQGHYENEVEYGYPSPCTGCVRRASDNFMPLPAAPEKGE